MENKFKEIIISTKKHYGQRIFSAIKIIFLLVLLILAFFNIDFQIFFLSIRALPFRNLLLYLLLILISKIIYAFRWQTIGKIVFPNGKILLFTYFQANLLAEFVSIVLPTSIGGEVTRVLKIRQQNQKTSYATISILIDRIIGITGMLVVSIGAIFLVEDKIKFDFKNIIPDAFYLPICLLLLAAFFITIIIFRNWIQKPDQKVRLARIANIVRNGFAAIVASLGLSIAGHIVFSLAHRFLIIELFPITWLETVAVILTPQLARTIPVSVLGISAGEGLMVASQMMTGMPREIALLITMVSLFGRYVFAILGFLLEFLKDGVSFFVEMKGKDHLEIND